MSPNSPDSDNRAFDFNRFRRPSAESVSEPGMDSNQPATPDSGPQALAVQPREILPPQPNIEPSTSKLPKSPAGPPTGQTVAPVESQPAALETDEDLILPIPAGDVPLLKSQKTWWWVAATVLVLVVIVAVLALA